jgi:hypothetical protein
MLNRKKTGLTAIGPGSALVGPVCSLSVLLRQFQVEHQRCCERPIEKADMELCMYILRKIAATTIVLIAAFTLDACSSSGKVGPGAVAGLTPDATVSMNQVQAAFIGSGGGGTGNLFYNGEVYHFRIGGLGVGGIGVSSIDAVGEVYKLHSLDEFPGTYAQARYGIAIGTASAGDLWLQNGAGVILHLKAKRTGLMLSLGGDAVVISMSK